MKKYLLDTHICIYYLKGMFDLKKKFEEVGIKNIYISEITLAELKFGAANSEKPKKNRTIINSFREKVKVIPIYSSLDYYAKEKARLKKAGTSVDDFDLLIGSSAVVSDLIMVTNNETHFKRLKKIKIEN